ncbi:MAG: CDP-2,3-bis-(O-geranylgeranyl)-sn-glycerol synthase [Candidatus Helarchaeota archaeon]
MSEKLATPKRPPLNPAEARLIKIFCVVIGVINLLCIVLMSIIWTIYDYLIILGLGMLSTGPAFIANAGMTFTGVWGGPGRPIDGGRNFIDGHRLFGKGKTWKGLIGGIIIGSTVSYLLLFIYWALQVGIPPEGAIEWNNLAFITRTEIFDVFLAPKSLISQDPLTNIVARTTLLAIGAPLGDLLGSFLKRRFGKERGAVFPLLDQIDFILVAYLFAYAFFPLPWYYILVITIFTPLVAILGNVVAYILGKKDVPW